MKVHIGKNIEFLRNLKGEPQKAVAAKLGISQQEYDRIEGKEYIDDELLQQIAKVLDYPVGAFKDNELYSRLNMVIQQSGNLGPVNFNFNPIDFVVSVIAKLTESKDEIILEKDARIAALEAMLKAKDK